MGYNGRFFVQLLPGHLRNNFSINKPTLKSFCNFLPQEKERAIIGLVFLFFYLLKADRKKTKTPTWSDDRVDGGRYRPTSLLPGYASP